VEKHAEREAEGEARERMLNSLRIRPITERDSGLTIGELAVEAFGGNCQDSIALSALDDVTDELALLGLLISNAGDVGVSLDEVGTRLWRISQRCMVAVKLHARVPQETESEVGKLRARLAEAERKLELATEAFRDVWDRSDYVRSATRAARAEASLIETLTSPKSERRLKAAPASRAGVAKRA